MASAVAKSAFWGFTGFVLALSIGGLDLATGNDISFSIFYLAPVCFLTWKVGKWHGVANAILCAFVWFFADHLASSRTSGPLLLWNASVRFGYFLGFSLVLTSLKDLQNQQSTTILRLEQTLSENKTLKGLLPICAWCKKIRDDQGYWKKFETYFESHSEIDFTHSICSDCLKKYGGDDES